MRLRGCAGLPEPSLVACVISTIISRPGSFYKFLWNSGPDRIKRNIIIKVFNAGGIQMINTVLLMDIYSVWGQDIYYK